MAEIFEHRTAYVESLAAFAPLEPHALMAGVKGLAIKLHDAGGNPLAEENAERLKIGHAARLRGVGFSLGMWSCPRTQPEGSAVVCSSLYGTLGLSFAVFETEWDYKTDGGGIDVGRLLRRWRELRPKAYTGCALEGLPTTFNYRAAAEHGARVLPENYWLPPVGHPSYDTLACFERARELGVDLALVHPTLTGVSGHSIAESIVRAYRARPAGFGRGVMVWRGDMLTAEDYRVIGLAGDLAR